MFCPACGFEYTQKTNYCKRCGGNLSASDKEPVTQLPGLKITGVFFVIAAFVLFSLLQVYNYYMKMLYANVRGIELFVPLLLGFALIGAVALLLVWLLSRVIAVGQKPADQTANQQRAAYGDVPPPGQLAAPTDPIRNAVEPPSVVEQTTRQMASVYRESAARE